MRFRSKEVWPLSSPDLNLMNFCVRSLLKADACASPYGSVEALKCSLLTAWAKMPQKTLHKVLVGFCSRLEHVIQARGDILNKILYKCSKMSCQIYFLIFCSFIHYLQKYCIFRLSKTLSAPCI